MPNPPLILLIATGFIAGVLPGVFGIGVGAIAANQLSGPYLRLAFSVFIPGLGFYLMFGAFRRLGWL